MGVKINEIYLLGNDNIHFSLTYAIGIFQTKLTFYRHFTTLHDLIYCYLIMHNVQYAAE